jgi:hypothetical protein
MNTGKAIFYGLALIALAIFARDIPTPANAGASETGRYAISAGNRTIWIIDTQTAKYRGCDRNDGDCEKWYDALQ